MVGLRRQRFIVLRRSTAPSTAGEAVKTYTPSGSLWASVNARTSREIDVQNRTIQEETTYDLVCRDNDRARSLKAEDVLEWRGQKFELSGNPMDMTGRRRELKIPVRVMRPSTL